MVMISVEISANRHGWLQIQILLLLILSPILVWGNVEGDALNALRQSLVDPSNVLQSWDPTLANPCTWFHVTCNSRNSVIRIDLGNAGLAGQLVPQLEHLTNLQYLEMYSNNISGVIPVELGKLGKLISLDLYQNKLTGVIPDSLGSLRNLQFLRLNNNSLTGNIPEELTNIIKLKTLDLSYNDLAGEVPSNGSFSQFNASSFVGNKNLCGEILNKQCHGEAPFPVPSPYGAPISSPKMAPTTTPYGAPTPTPYGAPTSTPYGAPISSPKMAPTPTPYGAPTSSPYGAQAPSPSSCL